MPSLTRWFIKTAFLYLVAALLVGLLLALRRLLPLPDLLVTAGPVYFHLFLVGWVTQLIFGTAYWLFPPLKPPAPQQQERLGWATFVLLNSGLLLRVVAEPQAASAPGSLWGWLLVPSALFQWLAALTFTALAWPRARERRRQRR